eukprot:gb/GECH01012847.1/.p1 GENE.gb/GECH01012847.1/~~gb/GECH01012847.1/.p1  ORF type:complete len:292 (+),score=73.16 gb/GECH01012847.1/:1-876(+)
MQLNKAKQSNKVLNPLKIKTKISKRKMKRSNTSNNLNMYQIIELVTRYRKILSQVIEELENNVKNSQKLFDSLFETDMMDPSFHEFCAQLTPQAAKASDKLSSLINLDNDMLNLLDDISYFLDTNLSKLNIPTTPQHQYTESSSSSLLSSSSSPSPRSSNSSRVCTPAALLGIGVSSSTLNNACRAVEYMLDQLSWDRDQRSFLAEKMTELEHLATEHERVQKSVYLTINKINDTKPNISQNSSSTSLSMLIPEIQSQIHQPPSPLDNQQHTKGIISPIPLSPKNGNTAFT